jgi:hypothetical protein
MPVTFMTLAGTLLIDPQEMTEPSDLKARLWYQPAATAMTFVAEAGTVVWPCVLLPHAITF